MGAGALPQMAREMTRFAAGFASGLLVAILAFAIYLAYTPNSSRVHRVSVSYPSRWDAGEYRNCRMKRPHYSGGLWPELECDGTGSNGNAVQGAHAFVMDVRFSGTYKIYRDGRSDTWTCQSSAAGTGELTCRDWY